MSAGEFADSKYSDDAGNVYYARVQPETLLLVLNSVTNAEPVGAIDQPVQARMTGSRRRLGVRARSVRLQFTGTPPDGYAEGDTIEIPIMTLTAYNAMKAVRRPTGTYLGAAVVGLGFTGESVR